MGLVNSPWEKGIQDLTAISGITKLDLLTGGWQDGEVVILAARQSLVVLIASANVL